MLLGQPEVHNNYYHDIHPPLVVDILDMLVSQVAISEVRSQASLGSGVVLCSVFVGNRNSHMARCSIRTASEHKDHEESPIRCHRR